jgi:asparagine synthase (glutamine-hydrolysing)
MCGIVGIINFEGEEIKKNELIHFKNSLSHRGPDGSNYFINEESDVGFGHTRLSILDTSTRSEQPFYYDKKRLVLTFNGEIYNFIEIKKELESFGYKFNTTSDTEVLLLAYDKWGSECQKKFNGMWAFAIWDQAKKKLFISRDRFGVKPLYYMLTKSRLYFASELKSFMYIKNQDIPDFNYSNFKYCSENIINGSYYLTEETFLKNVKELSPGCELNIYNHKNVKSRRWWSTIDNLVEVPKTYSEQKEKFFNIFKDACNLRMRSDVNIATSLSGGIDSSSIVSTINQIKKSNTFAINARNPYKTFILDYKSEKNNETDYARSVADFNKLDAEYVELDLGKINPEKIIQIIYHQEEVTGDDGIGPWYIYNSIKENGIKVSIDGHGGDELLGGYSGYPKIAMEECSIFELSRMFQLFKLHLQMNDNSLNNRNFIRVFIDKFYFRLKKKLKIQNSNSSQYNFLDIPSTNNNFDIKENINKLSKLNQALYIDYHYRAMQLNLKKYDKFSMAHGVECRFPFLDWKLATYLFSLPSKSKIGNGFTKRILRDVISDLLPQKVINRIQKKGFNPANELFNRTLKNFILKTISSNDFKNLGIWDKNKINKIINLGENLDFKKIFRNLQIFFLIKTFKEKAKNNCENK